MTFADKFDIGIIGAGVAGAFAALRLAQNHPNTKAIIFDLGRPPGKRRRQLEGWLGCFPAGDGKLYSNNEDILNLVDGRKAKPAFKWVLDTLSEVNPMKLIKDSMPHVALQKRIKEQSFEIKTNDYYQWKPDSIHQLSRYISETIETNENIKFSFDNEVFKITKKKGYFHINSSDGEFVCKKLIVCVGRSGWRWVTKLYKELGISANDDYAKFGIRMEIPGQYVKELNKSHCSLVKSDLEVGPFCWNGTVIPEDHADLVLSSFRSNEDRWKSDKVSFSVISSVFFKNNGCYETDRLAKLAFLLFNDRVSKEKLRMITKNLSQLCLLPEYNWLNETIENLDKIFPNLLAKGSYYVPDISPMASQIKLGANLESELDGFFVAGESSGIKGIMGAAITGCIAADSACK